MRLNLHIGVAAFIPWGCLAEVQITGFQQPMCLNQESPFSSIHSFCWLSSISSSSGLSTSLESSNSSAPPSIPNLHHLESSSHDWTSAPICVVEKTTQTPVCAFTDARFADGRGISIVATPESAESVARLASFSSSYSVQQAQSEPQAFEIKPLPGRGYGLIAKRTISRGELLFSSSPVFAAQAALENALPSSELMFLYHQAIERLPDEGREKFRALHGHFGGDEVGDRLETNAFNVFEFAMVFPETARMNHACRPNAHFHFDKSTFSQHIHAIRNISAGEEITLSYLPHYLLADQRSSRITTQWGFNCTCSLCSAPSTTISASDARIKEIQHLEVQLDNISTDRTAGVKEALKLVKLYEEEQLWGPVARAYWYVALEFSFLEEEEKMLEWAAKAESAVRIWKGVVSRESVEIGRLRAGDEEGRRHWSWGLARRNGGDEKEGE